jgi:hypothetical protein
MKHLIQTTNPSKRIVWTAENVGLGGAFGRRGVGRVVRVASPFGCVT